MKTYGEAVKRFEEEEEYFKGVYNEKHSKLKKRSIKLEKKLKLLSWGGELIETEAFEEWCGSSNYFLFSEL